MNRIIVIFFLSLFFFSCTSNTILKKPKDLIPKEQMVDVITDLFIAIEAKGIKNENLERNVDYAPIIFEKYQIDSTRFMESNLYYTSKIDEFNDILNEVDRRLKLLVDEYENVIEKNDSIERAKQSSNSVKSIETPKRKRLEENDD
jgi:hypothetical protein